MRKIDIGTALDGLWYDWGLQRQKYTDSTKQFAWLLMRIRKIEHSLEVESHKGTREPYGPRQSYRVVRDSNGGEYLEEFQKHEVDL